MRNVAALFHYKLSIDLMNEASALLIGNNSYKSFVKYANGQSNFVCDVTKAVWSGVQRPLVSEIEGHGTPKTEQEMRAGYSMLPAPLSVLRFEIEADHFLHGMVRAIVGTLIDVGRGTISVEEFKQIMNSEDRTMASMSAPACGLCLEAVNYAFDVWGSEE